MSRTRLTGLMLLSLALPGCSDRPGDGASAAPDSSAVAAPSASALAPAVAPPVVAPMAPLRPGGETLEHPDAQSIALLYHSFAPPAPVEEWIEADMRGSGANEFQRAPQRAKLEERFRRLVDEAGRVGRLVLHINAELSEYDAQGQRYYLDLFGSGSHLSWDYRGNQYTLDFANREDAQGWSLAPDAAQAVLERNRGSRDVVVTVTVDIVGHHARSNGGMLDGRITGYVIDGRWTDARLGQVTVVPEAGR